jgi:glycosyltransferase involved in cell wall biosynthesis
MSKPRIIVVTLSEPYPFGHVSARWYYALLKELSRRQYQIRCLSVTTNQRWAELASKAVEPLGVHLSLHPLSVEGNWLSRKVRTFRRPFSYALSNSLRTNLASEIRNGYDILHLEQLWAGYVADEHPRSLVAVHHLASLDLKGLQVAGNHRVLLERCLMQRGETRLLRRLGVITTLSERLVRSIRSINPRARVFLVPFGVDTSLYDFTAEPRSSEPVVGFLANMRWMPGFLAARRLITSVFPLVKQLIPGVKLLVVGWGAREALAEFLNYPDVTIAENVPDAQSYFERLQVFTYPLPQGSGVKVKILEAMAWGIPIVTTRDGVEGIEAVDGVHCFVAEENELFAKRVVELLRDGELRREFRQRARSLIEEQHSPRPVVDRLEGVYRVL